MGTRRTQLRHFSEKKNEEEKKSKDLVPGQFPQLIDVKPFFFPSIFSPCSLSLSLSLCALRHASLRSTTSDAMTAHIPSSETDNGDWSSFSAFIFSLTRSHLSRIFFFFDD